MNRLDARVRTALLGWPRWVKRLLAVALDGLFCGVSVWLSLSLRYDSWQPLDRLFLSVWAVSAGLAIPLFTRSGLYRAIFRYAGWNAVLSIFRATGYYALFFGLIYTFIGVPPVPRLVGVLQPLLLLVAVVNSRLVVHYWLGGAYRQIMALQKQPAVLIYGAGQAGRQLLSAITLGQQYRVIGYVDDDPGLQGRYINHCRIFKPEQIGTLVEQEGVSLVLLAMPSNSHVRQREILNELSQYQVHVQTVPALSDLISGRASLASVNEVDVDDLLGRDPVRPDEALLARQTADRVVLVTGAGGSIGSELCRQILARRPEKLLLVERSEYALYEIHQELEAFARSQGLSTEILPFLASVTSTARMTEIMKLWRPDTVYHAAAYKHVPLVEHNPVEGLVNNVWGTHVCAQAAMEAGVSSFVLISTDKAVRPTNIMGASKRLAEMVLQAMADEAMRSGQARTIFSMVRFGNVLGSSGSVVPLFRRQIAAGGPVTVTDPKIIRYFMTIPEASQLVIQAGAMARGGDVFVLDMGEPVSILALARRMIQLSGKSVRDEHNPQGDIEIEYTGLRPGEKLYEELLIGDDPLPTEHVRIMKASEAHLPWADLQRQLTALHALMRDNDIEAVKTLLKDLVSGYQPASEVVDWVWLERGGVVSHTAESMPQGGHGASQPASLMPMDAPGAGRLPGGMGAELEWGPVLQMER